MAASNDRFSIRGYAAKMRIVDLANSWPFAGGGRDEKLPPISMRQFRWWADELGAARSAAATGETIGHQSPEGKPAELGEEELRSPKAKGRMLKKKKRSIVELFASAPQIEAAADRSTGEDGEKMIMEKRKGKRRKGAIKMEIRALKKEKVCETKMLSSGHSHLLQDPTNTKALRKTVGVVESKNFVKVKTLQKKRYILQTPKLRSRNKEVVKKLSVRSILKNKSKFTSVRKTGKINDAKTADFIKLYCKTKRHVTFSEKDDILGHGKKRSNLDLPQFKSLCKIFSDVLTASSVMNNSSKVHELPAANDGSPVVNASEEDTNAGVDDRKDESSSQNNQLSDSLGNVNHRKIVNSSNSSCSGTDKSSMAVMIDLNHATDLDCFNPSKENFSPSCTNSVDLNFSSTTQKKGSSTSAEFHLQGLPKISFASITPNERNFVSTSNAADLLTAMKNPRPHSSTSCQMVFNEKNEKQCQQYFDVGMNCSHHIPENQSRHHCSQKDFLSSNNGHFMGSNKFRGSAFMSNSVSTSKSKSTCEDFISLPLNKRGELIQMHPGAKFIWPYKKHNMDLASSHGFYANKQVEHDKTVNHLEIMKEKVPDAASYQNDQLDWCQNQYHPTRDRRFTEFIGPERLKSQNNEPFKGKYEFLHSLADKTKLSFHDGKFGDATLDFFKRVDLRGKCDLACQFEPVVQQTIRLMGQNVVVGGSNRDCQSSIMPEKYHSKQWKMPEFVANTTCGSSAGNLHKLADSPSIFYHTTEHVEPKFGSDTEDHGSECLSRRNIFSTTGNNIFNADVDSHVLPHKSFSNKTDMFMGNSISGEESVGRRHQYYPTIASYQQNIPQNMQLSSAHCKHSQGVSCAALVTPQSQIQYNVHGSPYQPVQIQPPEKLPQWFLQAKHQNRNKLSISPYSDPRDLSQPCGFSETNLIPHLCPYTMPMIPFPFDNIPPTKISALAPNSSQSSVISVVTATNSISEVTKSSGIMNKEGEGSYTNMTGSNSPVDAHKFQKRLIERDNVIMNSAKRPYFEKQAYLSIPVEPRGIEMLRDHPFLDYATAFDVRKAPNVMDELSNTESSSFSRLKKESAVGTTKLIPGARHVLKPSQKNDDGNFIPVHLTATFPAKPGSGKILSTPKKITKVYKF